MARGLPYAVLVVLCATFATCVFAWGDDDCKAYTDSYNIYHAYQTCSYFQFCCGTCSNRECCNSNLRRLSDDAQDKCYNNGKFFTHTSSVPVVPVVISSVIGFLAILIVVCCCVCPCCCLYSLCRKPRPVVATTHTTVVTSIPQQYPQQPTAVASPPQPYQATQHHPYQPMPVQPSYGTQGMPTFPHQGQQFPPPPTYQEATGPSYPPQPMPYSQAAYGPGQPAYPLQPSVQPHPNVPPAQMDYLSQPAYNPDFVAPPKTG
uniref:Protein shisa-5 n=1 Tax=Nothobranchius pienaari TaxID=704102 RepID=A0A1A8LR43_9TELE